MSKLLDATNARLKASKIGLTIEVLQDRLCLRGTLPPKPDSGKTKPFQQRIYLGYPVTADSIRQAERDPITIGEFNWEQWSQGGSRKQQNVLTTIAQLVSQFEVHYFTRRARTPKSEHTFLVDYKRVFNKLPQEKELSAEIILAAVADTAPQSRQRRRYCIALKALAKFAGVEVDLRQFTAGYAPAKLEPRSIPSDAEIVQVWQGIKNLAWRNAYGLLASYGLRPHEIWHLDLSEFPVVMVTEGKTGGRTVRPIPPEWIELFGLSPAMELPQVTGRNNGDLGHRVNVQFDRLAIPHLPYDLRHAFAIRGSVVHRLPTAVMAKMMGHSPTVHLHTYNAWLSEERIEQAYRETFRG